MNISNNINNYLNGFDIIYDYRLNTRKENIIATIKIVSYFIFIVPICIIAYKNYNVVKKDKDDLSTTDIKVNYQVDQNLNMSLLNSEPTVDSVKNINNVSWIDRLKSLKVSLSQVLKAYHKQYVPKLNAENLEIYSHSEDFHRHAKTARIYYNWSQLAKNDALRIAYQREPTNIAMGPSQYNKEELNKLFGYECSAFNSTDVKKKDGTLFKQLPNSIAIYSETFLWDPPGGDNKKEIACLSLPAPALDNEQQPHHEYYMQTGELDIAKYDNEMAFLFRCIEKAIRDNKDTAFNNQGIKRVVLSRIGQKAFLGPFLSKNDREAANSSFRTQLKAFMENVKNLGLDIVMSEHTDPGDNKCLDKMIIGDIITTSQDGDLIINAWDPHSAPGNGNDIDKSFDGAMGKSSGILLTQTSWLNERLRDISSLVPVV